MATTEVPSSEVLHLFHPVMRMWFRGAFAEPTGAQQQAWPAIAGGKHTLLLAPTGSGKTLAAFLVALDRLMFRRETDATEPGIRVLYISPLKALGVDVERNLASPLAGVRAVAEREEAEYHLPSVAVRSGDTPQKDRYQILRHPPDILITTPESLYLMLTSRARETLRTVETVIVDEIHSLASTKRGAHLFLSLERLEDLRREKDSELTACQRIGLSATQRPLEEIARLLGGAESSDSVDSPLVPREVEIIESGRRKQLQLEIHVPVEDMARLGEEMPSGPAAAGLPIPSIWPSIHPRLVELIRQHRSTMIFVNSRRLAERLALAINELADEELALAHHGSIAKDARRQIEDRLKLGSLPAIVATSSLELGIDMGAVDLVIQIEAPPSIASGIQRIGRAGHQVGAPSTGVIFPKYRGDLLACGAAAARMINGEVEATYYPRNPLDVLAQQLVAMAAQGVVSVGDLYRTVRRAAPFHELPRSSFEGVLDLLSGRYPSDEFAELRPRITWDRVAQVVQPRKGTQRVAVANAGTIPDRGLYGVFLADGAENGSRVGELDEEMVFETQPGDVFLLGASSWKVVDITHDRVLVVPAPGEPGRMPFWRGDGPGRPLEFGRAIGQLAREMAHQPEEEAIDDLTENHALQPTAARNLWKYLRDQSEATCEVPSDTTLVVESFLDEVGDWRVAVLSPFGSRVHAPWAMAIAGKLRELSPQEVDWMWTDDGMVFRLPESDQPPPADLFFPGPEEIEDLVVRELSGSALFAARFRENSARALLLPKRRPGKRSPLWLQRRKSADLLAVAARYPNFPMLLETYRECLRDTFDLPGLRRLLQEIRQRSVRVHAVQTQTASPFAASLLFSYTGNFLYNGDTPLAERRAQALSLDHAQLRELLGDAELRELLDPESIDVIQWELQRLDPRFHVGHIDDLHELLLKLGDLSHDELLARTKEMLREGDTVATWLRELEAARRVVHVRIAGETRYVAVEDAGRYRAALGVILPPGLPEIFLEAPEDPWSDLVSRHARTHGPFRVEEVAARFGVGVASVQEALRRLVQRGRVLEGEFLPGGREREWCDADVLRRIKRRSLARWRKQVEPVSPAAFARFLGQWQGCGQPRHGLDGILDVVEQLQGIPLPASTWERDILPCRVADFRTPQLDELCAAGEIVWRGFDSLVGGDGKIALYLANHFLVLAPSPQPAEGEHVETIRALLAEKGALFFDDLQRQIGGFRNDVLQSLWDLVWSGEVTNDTLVPLRSLRRGEKRQRSSQRFRSRRVARTPGSEGRWSLLLTPQATLPNPTERQTQLVRQLLDRYGVLTREAVAAEGVSGGFAGIYPILKAMEEAGQARRGYFVAGLGAAQFALPGAEDRLRQYRDDDHALKDSPPNILAATDPANPYGAALPWPDTSESTGRPQRAAGARVILWHGELIGYLARTGQALLTFLPSDSSEQRSTAQALAAALVDLATSGQPVLLAKIDGGSPVESPFAEFLRSVGFVPTSRGLLHKGNVTSPLTHTNKS